ncbi:hypothetical protein O0I10_007651 [Lichtheimia ornata]|uniref:Uncharacterized protein n=1 Tax=Lichtheimia ornata TaxID=688661 RepID=A0AAD7UZM8_9FUNG|nr:uncharacterized protein O0I10_007651 [Lichtheimia ornata]KAJ8656574.1 hypothetical protein O0I10_007651 [Lichtheimia ornata]
MEAKKTQLILWSVNLAMTSQALFRISPRFFGQYQLHRPTQLVNGQTIKQDSIRSRILLKTIRSIFRKNTMLELLQQCHLDQCTDKSHLQLKLVASDGATKTHSLWYGETDPAKALYTKETQHRFSIDPGYFIDYLQCFHPRVTDVAIECTPDAVKLKSYWNEGVSSSNDRPMHSEFTINSCDFSSYIIRRNVQLAFGLKEFKTALNYAMETKGLISAYFDEPGKPIVFTAEVPGSIIADFALVTKAEESVPTQTSANHSGISYGSRTGYR